MTAVGITPCGPVAAEDVRDLQSWPGHGGPALCPRFLLLQRQPLQRAHHCAQHVGGDMGVTGGRVQLRMAHATPGSPARRYRSPAVRSEGVRSVCGVTQLPSPPASAAIWQTRLSWRTVIGWSGSRPGNSQPLDRHCSHHAPGNSRTWGDSMAYRSLRPLPTSTRISMRWEAMSPTRSMTTAQPPDRRRRRR